uniref:testis-expressed protein 47 n=1 Tax=Semicossyphus pulcher TaxID=241346 RepID=UPI0037E977B2
MASSQKIRSFSFKSCGFRDPDEEEMNMFDVLQGKMREKIVLQRLILIARLPHHLADRTEVGAHYERLNFQLSKQYLLDPLTGLLLIYPHCALHIIESSQEVLLSVLKDLKEMQQQPQGTLLEAPKVVFLEQNPDSRMFQQWSYKELRADQVVGDTKRHEEEEESTETLLCTVLSVTQKLGDQMEISKSAVPGSVLDETKELIVSQKVLEKLLTRDELLTPQQYLQMYDSPLNISMDFGQVIRSSRLTTV